MERGPWTGRLTKPLQERPEPAVVIEGINTIDAHVSGLFNVRLSAEWRERPTFDALAAEIEAAIMSVLQRHAQV